MLVASLHQKEWFNIILAIVYVVLVVSAYRQGGWRRIAGLMVSGGIMLVFFVGGYESYDYGVLPYYLVPYMAVGYVCTLLNDRFYDFRHLGRHKWRKLPWRLIELTLVSAFWFEIPSKRIVRKIDPDYYKPRNSRTRKSNA